MGEAYNWVVSICLKISIESTLFQRRRFIFVELYSVAGKKGQIQSCLFKRRCTVTSSSAPPLSPSPASSAPSFSNELSLKAPTTFGLGSITENCTPTWGKDGTPSRKPGMTKTTNKLTSNWMTTHRAESETWGVNVVEWDATRQCRGVRCNAAMPWSETQQEEKVESWGGGWSFFFCWGESIIVDEVSLLKWLCKRRDDGSSVKVIIRFLLPSCFWLWIRVVGGSDALGRAPTLTMSSPIYMEVWIVPPSSSIIN